MRVFAHQSQGVITISATKVTPTGTGMTTPRSVRSILDVVMLVGLFIVVLADGVAQGLEGAIIPTVLVFQARKAQIEPI